MRSETLTIEMIRQTRVKYLGPLSKKRALAIAIAITLLTMLLEFAASLFTGSLMLFSDAVHMLSHASSLLVTYLAMVLATRIAGKHFPFGLHRVEILAALFNGVSLLFFSGYVIFEAVERFLSPVEVDSFETIVVAFIGLAVNLFTALILSRAKLEDINTKSAFIHLLADTFSSVAIIIGGVIIYYTKWFVVDAILSVVVAAVILKWAWGLLKEATFILLERTPAHIHTAGIEDLLCAKFENVTAVSELKIWEITTGKYAGNLRLYCPGINPHNQNTLRERIALYLRNVHDIHDLCIEIYY